MMSKTKTISFCAAWLSLALFLGGCAESSRIRVSTPPLAESPTAATIFGEATIASGGKLENATNIPLIPTNRPLSLQECIEIAKKVSPSIDSADQTHVGAMWDRWKAITDFLPTANTSYGVTSYDDRTSLIAAGHYKNEGKHQYTLKTNVTQPVFTGGRNVSSYLLSQLGVNAAEIQKIQAHEDLILAVKRAYYDILANQKALAVAKQTVINLQSHLKVAQNFFDVGMVPKNQVLEAEVELAKAVQKETDLTRDLIVAKSRMNILLRQPIENRIEIVDDLTRKSFPLNLRQCLNISETDSPELKLGRNYVDSSAKGVDIARSAYFPTITAQYTNTTMGNTPRAHGGWSSNDAGWNMALMASFNVWEWGRSKADVEKSKVALNKSVNNLLQLEDNTKLEVTSNYQSLVSAGKNIDVSAKAITSAAEDLRMVRERYKEQVATNTEVLDAQTRYSQAQYDHYQALYNYNLAWATLERSLGRRVTNNSQSLDNVPVVK